MPKSGQFAQEIFEKVAQTLSRKKWKQIFTVWMWSLSGGQLSRRSLLGLLLKIFWEYAL